MFSIVGMFPLSFNCVRGYEFAPEAIGVMLYALFTYHWRAAAIRRGSKQQQYDDRIGPVSSTRCFQVPILF